ncbi:hypothetical protein [Merismopedia glauca]|nr:hypothetical protein [Merismopedia glauca]
MAYFAARNDWELVVLGSSEVKWGIDPSQIEQSMAAKGVKFSGFNLGFDGFNENFYLSILPSLKLPHRLPKLKVVLVGINLVEEKQILPQSFNEGFPCDGILQRAVLKSDFAKDYDLEHLCNSTDWTQPLVKEAEKISAIVRYRRSLRTLLLSYQDSRELIGEISNGLKQYPNGFHAHKSAKDNWASFEEDYHRFLAEKKTQPQNFRLMKSDAWSKLLEKGGFFEGWADYFLDYNILPVFFALPTNPLMIDDRHRREDYQRNSQLMTQWAKQHQVVYLDLGICDRYDDYIDYSDHRHLSEIGAIRYSRELGTALAGNTKVVQALSHSSSSRDKLN